MRFAVLVEQDCAMPDVIYDFEGGEFDWFLVDGKGRLALCSSAGFGEVPSSVLRGLEEDQLPIGLIEHLVECLPQLANHQTEGSGPGACVEFRQLADRGIFVFDWQHWRGPYQRIVVPEVCLDVQRMEAGVLEKLRAVVVEPIDLAETKKFQVADLGIEFVSGNLSYIDAGPEPVLMIWDFYDGVRTGLAMFGGRPHYFRCLFDDEHAEYSDRFELFSVTDEFLQKANRQWQIYQDWEREFQAGKASHDSHPGHGGVSAEYDALEVWLADAIEGLQQLEGIYSAKFAVLPGQEDLPRGGVRELGVTWQRVV